MLMSDRYRASHAALDVKDLEQVRAFREFLEHECGTFDENFRGGRSRNRAK
jgi:hypothetical protein